MNQKHLFLLFYSHIPLTLIILKCFKITTVFRAIIKPSCGALAQLIERGIRIAEVAGLIPARSTKKSLFELFEPKKFDSFE